MKWRERKNICIRQIGGVAFFPGGIVRIGMSIGLFGVEMMNTSFRGAIANVLLELSWRVFSILYNISSIMCMSE